MPSVLSHPAVPLALAIGAGTDVVPLRLAGASDPKARARILEDAAVCAETRAGDHKRAGAPRELRVQQQER